MATIGRSHRSVEFKHQNISAVLEELGMPWIPGYKPKRNYQNAIFDALDRYLTKNSGILEPSPPQQPIASDSGHVFVDAPVRRQPSLDKVPSRLQQLIMKFDPVERDHRNRTLGRAGESFVIDIEKRRLIGANRSDLAHQVRWVAAEEGDGAGYDIASFSLAGHPQLIEVKTTNGSCRTPFFLSRNEYNISRQFSEQWLIYRVHLFATRPRIFTIAPPLESSLTLTTETWRAAF